MERKRSCEKVTLPKKYLVKKQFSWKSNAIECSVFWKSSRSKKAALQEKYVIESIAFLLFPKCSFPEKVDDAQKCLLWKSNSSVDIFFSKQFLRQEDSCFEK